MSIDGPTRLNPQPIAPEQPETFRHSFSGLRQALLGIELTLLAGLVVLLSGPMGVAGLGAAVLGGVGLILVLTGTVAPSGGRQRR